MSWEKGHPGKTERWPGEDPAEWAWRRLGFEADAAQAQVLRSGSKRGILNCTRQWGKSTVTAAKALYQAMHVERSLTLVASPSARQSGEFLKKAAEFVRRLGIQPKGDGGNEISLALPNGSRIVGLPGSEATVRGFSGVGLLLVDEASRVSDDLYHAVTPMLAVTDGAMWLMSTPFGKRGFFWEAWANGGPEWERIRALATECPRIKAEFLESERRSMGERTYRREYQCEFDELMSSVFPMDAIDRAFTDEIQPLGIE